MKVFLIVFFCLQQTDLELDKTCVTEIQREPHNNMGECMLSLSQVKLRAKEVLTYIRLDFVLQKI